jgi:hypothetical protein
MEGHSGKTLEVESDEAEIAAETRRSNQSRSPLAEEGGG